MRSRYCSGELLHLICTRLLLPPEMGEAVYGEDWRSNEAGSETAGTEPPSRYRATSAELVSRLAWILDDENRPEYYWLRQGVDRRPAPYFSHALTVEAKLLRPDSLNVLSAPITLRLTDPETSEVHTVDKTVLRTEIDEPPMLWDPELVLGISGFAIGGAIQCSGATKGGPRCRWTKPPNDADVLEARQLIASLGTRLMREPKMSDLARLAELRLCRDFHANQKHTIIQGWAEVVGWEVARGRAGKELKNSTVGEVYDHHHQQQ